MSCPEDCERLVKRLAILGVEVFHSLPSGVVMPPDGFESLAILLEARNARIAELERQLQQQVPTPKRQTFPPMA